ncbi:MAG: B-box zinc finger protein [Bryobacteraceae bacterium]
MAIACAACSLPIPEELWNREEDVRCRGCGRNVRALVFPAIGQAQLGAAPIAIDAATEASCFYHPGSRAAQVCVDCGRFLCNLCDLEVDGRHICPRCFDSREIVETSRPLYDTMALAMSTLPAILIWPSLVGAPWALFLVFRRWNAPLSLVPRTKIRFVLAALFALAEIGFLVFIIYMMTQVGIKPRPTKL